MRQRILLVNGSRFRAKNIIDAMKNFIATTISIVAIGIAIVAMAKVALVEELDFDYYGAIIGVLSFLVTLPMEFLWSEDMADASVHVLLNVNFSDIIGIEKYSSVHYGATTDGAVDRNHSAGRGGYIPSLGEIRNCHINVGTGKELTIRELSELVVKAVGFEGTVEFDASKPDGTMRKLIDVSKLHSLGWTHKVEIEDGVAKLFEWYRQSLA